MNKHETAPYSTAGSDRMERSLLSINYLELSAKYFEFFPGNGAALIMFHSKDHEIGFAEHFPPEIGQAKEGIFILPARYVRLSIDNLEIFLNTSLKQKQQYSRMNKIDPQTWLSCILEHIVNHNVTRLDELMARIFCLEASVKAPLASKGERYGKQCHNCSSI